MNEAFDFRKFTELIVFFLILATTIHAQDFRDVEGDRGTGRNTLPMMFPAVSRVTMVLFLPLWTSLVVAFCKPSIWLGAVYISLSLVVGVRFFVFRRCEDDKWSYFVYNVSIGIFSSLALLISLSKVWLSFTILHLCLFKNQGHEEPNPNSLTPVPTPESVNPRFRSS
jgi:1,4-dihydroxy-2-naphthoate octaprenyltransferase